MRLYKRFWHPLTLVVLAMLTAFVGQGIPLVHAASLSLVSGMVQTGTILHAASCEQPPAQSVKDRASYSDAELVRYGLPPRPSASSIRYNDWASGVRGAKTRHCDRTVINATNGALSSTVWGGYVATNQQFEEAYAVFYVPCATGNFYGKESTWVGLGGWYSNNLVQTGTAVTRHQDWLGRWVTDYTAWVENLGDPSNPWENDVFGVNCNDKMQAQIPFGFAYESHYCMYIDDMTTNNYGTWCYGPGADLTTAEAVIERPFVNGSQVPLADFQSETLYNVLVAANEHDYAMDQVISNSDPIWATDYSHALTTLSSITNDANIGPPYDKYTLNWLHSQ